jgi:beta-lactamase superfamily II metal-dependent hydrolase
MGKLHHLDVGCADASIIQSSNFTFIIDCNEIERYSYLLPASKYLRGVFITHQHRDHYSGLEYLRNNGYSIGCLIYSPYTRRYADSSVTSDEWTEFASHRDYFESKGTALRAPFRQPSFAEPYWDIDGIKIWMLGPEAAIASSDTRELHDACLVFRVDCGERKCTFTGDASDCNLNWIGKNTTHACDDILHASHHGSMNGADLDFLKACSMQYTVISTKCGVHENVPDPIALKRYENNTSHKVYRTDQDGTLTWTF